MHDAFRRTSCAGGKGKITDAVRVAPSRRVQLRCPRLWQAGGLVGFAQRGHGGERRLEFALSAVGPPAWLGHEGTGRESIEQVAYLRAGIGTVKGGIAGIAVARAG